MSNRIMHGERIPQKYDGAFPHLSVVHGVPEREIERAIVVGTGPSVASLDWGMLADVRSTVFAVNYAAHVLPRTDYWVSLGTHSWEPMAAMNDYGIATNQPKPVCRHPTRFISKAFRPRNTPTGLRGTFYVVPMDEFAGDRKAGEWDGQGFSTAGARGGESGIFALEVAMMMGATRIALLGLDGEGDDFWQPAKAIERWGKYYFPKGYEQTRSWGVEVFNGSPTSIYDGWPRMEPERAIELVEG